MKRNKWMFFLFIVLIAVIAGLFVFRYRQDSEKTSAFWETIDSYCGYSRVISREEYDFYQKLVKRDLSRDVSAEALEKQVKAYAAEVNAAFYLGNQLGLCEPYSFETLEFRMEQENAARRVKLEQGEAVYGLEQFDLQTYFLYTRDQVETSLHQYLEEHLDETVIRQAEQYYEENKNSFRSREKVTYQMTIDGKTDTVSVDAQQLDFLGKSDRGLGDFLLAGEVGEYFEDVQENQLRQAVIEEVVYSKEGFEHNQQIVLYKFVRNELYQSVILRVAQNNPVEFE